MQGKKEIVLGCKPWVIIITMYCFRSSRAEQTALAFGAGGAAVGVLAIVFKEMKLGLLVPLALSVAATMEYSARGTSELYPSLAARAQKHVHAGAEMTRIHRLAELYGSELQTMPLGNYGYLTASHPHGP